MPHRHLCYAILSFVLAGCQVPNVALIEGGAKEGRWVDIEVPALTSARGLSDDAAVASVAVTVRDSLDTVVGSAVLVKQASGWRGRLSLSADGLLTFSARALGSTGLPLYGGTETCIVTSGSSVTISVSPSQVKSGAVVGAPLSLSGAVSALAGYGPDRLDGMGVLARFGNLSGFVTVGAKLYLCDGNAIRAVDRVTGVVTTLAGHFSESGYLDGVGTQARFYQPSGIATDGLNLYVTDTKNFRIRKIVVATGEVSTLAGSDNFSPADGTGAAAHFYQPGSLACDGTNLFVQDYHSVRRILLSTGAVTTLAGNVFSSGYVEGTGTTVRFNSPVGLWSDGTVVYVADLSNHSIRRILIATGETTTWAGGGAGAQGSTDDVGPLARFYSPSGLASDGVDLFVSDSWTHTVRVINLTSVAVTTFAGLNSVSGYLDATGTSARFYAPGGLALVGGQLYVADTGNKAIRQIDVTSKVVSTLAGAPGRSGTADGTGLAARFNNPSGMATDGVNLYLADEQNNTIRKVVLATGAVSTFAGTAPQSGSANNTGTLARFSNPKGLTTDGQSLYVADTSNSMIRKIDLTSRVVTTVAGKAGYTGTTDSPTFSSARFNYPQGIATDGTDLYVADTSNATIRKVSLPTGAVTTVAGFGGQTGYVDGAATVARFSSPTGIATDGTRLFVADKNNKAIRQIVLATGQVTTLAGGPSSSAFSGPGGITTDGTNLYVVDSNDSVVRRVVIATGVVTTVAGESYGSWYTDDVGAKARFFWPSGIATDGVRLYVADTYNHTLRQIE